MLQRLLQLHCKERREGKIQDLSPISSSHLRAGNVTEDMNKGNRTGGQKRHQGSRIAPDMMHLHTVHTGIWWSCKRGSVGGCGRLLLAAPPPRPEPSMQRRPWCVCVCCLAFPRPSSRSLPSSPFKHQWPPDAGTAAFLVFLP